MNDTAPASRWASVRAKSLARRARQAAPQIGMADHAAASASKTPEASKSAERGSADRQPHAFAASPAEPTPADAASPELAQVVLAQAAELGRQAGFQANASHLELAYRVHRLLVAAREGELAIPHGVDRGAVRRFVDDVFFTTQFLDEDIHSEGKARASRPLDRSNVTQGLPATGVVGDSETTDRESDVCRPNSGAGAQKHQTANPASTQTRKHAASLRSWSSFTRPA
jgi:hypothetical protein